MDTKSTQARSFLSTIYQGFTSRVGTNYNSECNSLDTNLNEHLFPSSTDEKSVTQDSKNEARSPSEQASEFSSQYYYPQSEMKLDSACSSNSKQDQAFSERFNTDSEKNDLARVAAIQLLSACFTLPLIGDSTDISTSILDQMPQIRLENLTDFPMISSLQMHSEFEYRTSVRRKLDSYPTPTRVRLKSHLYRESSFPDSSLNPTQGQRGVKRDESKIKRIKRLKSRSVPQALYVTQGLSCVNKVLMPQSLHQGIRLDHQLTSNQYSKQSLSWFKLIRNSIKGKRRDSHEQGDQIHLSLTRKSDENLYQNCASSFEIQFPQIKKKLNGRSKGQDVMSICDASKTSIKNRSDAKILPSDYGKTKSDLTKLVSLEESDLSRSSSNRSSSELKISNLGLDRSIKSQERMKFASEVKTEPISIPSAANNLSPNKNRVRRRGQKTSEVWSSDYLFYRGSPPKERNVLSVNKSALASVENCFQDSVLSGENDFSPILSTSPPLFIARMKNKRRSFTQISTPDDFSANAVRYGERGILSLIGSPRPSPMSNISSSLRFKNRLSRASSIRSAPNCEIEEINELSVVRVSTSGTEIFTSMSERPNMTNYRFGLRKPKIQNQNYRSRKERTIY